MQPEKGIDMKKGIDKGIDMRKGLGKIRKIKKKYIFLALLAVIVLGGLAKAYSAWVGTTRIAFLNYQAIALGQISHANDNAMIKLSEITTDDFDHLDDYDMIIVNGMGLRIDENQRKQLEEASYKVPTLTHAATNPANNIVSVDNFDADYLMQYIENGGKKNYQSMLAYIRKFIDGKKFMAPEPERVNERPDYLLTHFDPKDEKGDELGFNSIREYNAFLVKNGLYKEGAPTIMLTGSWQRTVYIKKVLLPSCLLVLWVRLLIWKKLSRRRDSWCIASTSCRALSPVIMPTVSRRMPL